MEITYFGYDTQDVSKAIAAYTKRKGLAPTLVVARPEIPLENETDIVFRSRFGIADGILVTHMATVQDMIDNEKMLAIRAPVIFTPSAPSESRGYRIPTRKPGRPEQDGGRCPHCGGHIHDFNNLGYWYGWAIGKEPPYWEKLREYVFARDKHTCQTCRRRLPPSELRCHHLIAKEIMGSDSARNITTLCGACHPDEHPIFSDDEE